MEDYGDGKGEGEGDEEERRKADEEDIESHQSSQRNRKDLHG